MSFSSAYNRNVYIASLPEDFTDARLRELFEPFGRIIACCAKRERRSGGNGGGSVCKGYGFVLFEKEDDALNAVLALQGHAIGHTKVQVRLARPEASAKKVFPVLQQQQQHLFALHNAPAVATPHGREGGAKQAAPYPLFADDEHASSNNNSNSRNNSIVSGANKTDDCTSAGGAMSDSSSNSGAGSVHGDDRLSRHDNSDVTPVSTIDGSRLIPFYPIPSTAAPTAPFALGESPASANKKSLSNNTNSNGNNINNNANVSWAGLTWEQQQQQIWLAAMVLLQQQQQQQQQMSSANAFFSPEMFASNATNTNTNDIINHNHPNVNNNDNSTLSQYPMTDAYTAAWYAALAASASASTTSAAGNYPTPQSYGYNSQQQQYVSTAPVAPALYTSSLWGSAAQHY